MTWKLPPGPASRLAGPILSALARSWRIERVHEDRWRAVVQSGRPHVYLLWHEALLPLLWAHRGQAITIVVSEARDGRYLAEYALRLGYQQALGSSTRGGVRALLSAVKALQGGGAAAFTPDGPRGPRRQLKDGVLVAAQRGGAVVLPLHASADRAWRLTSWDRFLIPKPFARVRIAYGTAFEVSADDTALTRGRRVALAGLNEAINEAGWDDAATRTG